MIHINDFPLADLHFKYAFKKSSELLLEVALLVRAFDDQMKDSSLKDEYISFTRKNDCGEYIGNLLGREKFYLRQACNKVIHASEVRPLYEKSDVGFVQPDDAELGDNMWYLTGEIELSGKERDKKWDAVLYITNFLETVLGLISFKPSGA